MKSSREKMQRRAQRNRIKLRKVANGRPRLSVFRSSKHIYAQLIDDKQGVTIASASTAEKDTKGSGANVDAATDVGKRLADFRNQFTKGVAIGGKRFGGGLGGLGGLGVLFGLVRVEQRDEVGPQLVDPLGAEVVDLPRDLSVDVSRIEHQDVVLPLGWLRAV